MQDQLAALVGLEKSSISTYENDMRQPSYETLVRFADVFNVSVDYLLGRRNDRQLDLSGLTAAEAWYAPYVSVIQAAGIVNGVGDGKNDPNDTVTWAQIITILTRFVELQKCTLQHIQYGGWAVQAIQTAVARGGIEDRADFAPDASISRGQLEQLINNVLALYR